MLLTWKVKAIHVQLTWMRKQNPKEDPVTKPNRTYLTGYNIRDQKFKVIEEWFTSQAESPKYTDKNQEKNDLL